VRINYKLEAVYNSTSNEDPTSHEFYEAYEHRMVVGWGLMRREQSNKALPGCWLHSHGVKSLSFPWSNSMNRALLLK
jgi:hypothetical protein